jgi:hypothetical protein
MRNIRIIALLLYVAVVMSGCSGGKGAAIAFDGEKYKFGEIVTGENVVFTFIFKNTGTRDLVIEGLDVSCFCVHVKQYDKIVTPGERGKIYGVIETKGFEGNVVKAIQVKTNIPNQKPSILTIEGTILPRKP